MEERSIEGTAAAKVAATPSVFPCTFTMRYTSRCCMYHIIYLSRAVREPSPGELVRLLLQARSYNEQVGITGALAYGDKQFMQVLEGEETVVTALYERIARDPRHQSVFKLADKAIAERSFISWSMAFREVTPGEFADLTGYASPAQWEQLTFGSASADVLLLERIRELVVGGQ